MRKRNNHGGYTMVLFLAFIAAILLAGFSLYDNGTVATERIRMQNTADATAYSTVNVVTRNMNFIAYTNRAMVANQVAIAQMLGIASWMKMIDQTAENLDTAGSVLALIPYVGAVIKEITTTLASATEAAEEIVAKAMEIAIEGLEIALAALSFSQINFHLITAEMGYATFNAVSLANDPDINSGIIAPAFAAATLIESWAENVETYETATTDSGTDNVRHRKRFTEFAKVVTNSRDPFTKERNSTWLSAVIVGVGGKVHKKGGNEFKEVTINSNELQWQWTATDNVSMWVHYWDWESCGFLCEIWAKQKKEAVPLGWGAAHALNENVSGSYYNYEKGKSPKWWGNAWSNNWSESLALSWYGNNNLTSTEGLRTFIDLKKEDYQDVGPNMVVLLAKPRNTIKVQQSLDDNSSSYNRNTLMTIEEQGSVAGGNMYGLSKAETYFSRPRDLWLRADTKREYGNLYNPYWQTRLIENNTAEQAVATAVQVVF